MVLQPTSNNLVRNGNFANHGTYWSATATAPGRVDFSRQHCIITATGQAEQDLAVSDATTYTFSVFTLITYNGKGSAQLVFQPSGTTESIVLDGNHGWLRNETSVNTPAGTTGVTVKLVGDAGDVWFDNVRLVEEEGTIIPIELVSNGDFAEDRKDWILTATPPGTVSIHDNRCVANHGGHIEQVITVTPGQTYDFSIDAMTPSGGHGFAIFDFAPDNAPQIELRGDGGWDTYTHSLTIPEGIPEFTLRVIAATFLEVDNLSLKTAVARKTKTSLSSARSDHPHVYSPAQENRIMTTATAQKTAHRKAHEKYFQGSIGDEVFKANYVTHTLMNRSRSRNTDMYWLLEGTQKAENSTNKTVIVFKYLYDREKLPSGRYTLKEDERESRFSVIIMRLGNANVPAYTAERGTVEFFHDDDTNHTHGALDVYFTNAQGAEVRVQILFSE
ncbi:hypothetical protein [Pseudomonas sp. MIACH]|uniref:hypothetical protein n=1 Tax=Pseudomonas sp. MIACH TaxID=1078355 RepID=UPI00069D3431|nr:hypothetical protein [Pseudomonas sp. MIACH]